MGSNKQINATNPVLEDYSHNMAPDMILLLFVTGQQLWGQIV